MNRRRSFMKSAMGLGAAGTMGAMAAGAATGDRSAVQGGISLGNLYFSSGLTGVRPEARKDPLPSAATLRNRPIRFSKRIKQTWNRWVHRWRKC